MKQWRLDNQQRVCVDRHCNVHFQHYLHENRYTITLRWRQFLNLNDVVRDLDTFHNIKYYPLGKNLWLQYDRNGIQFYDCKQKRYFTFHDRSWQKYIKETNRCIRSFLRHEALPRREHVASDATQLQSQSGGDSSLTTQQQTLSRTTPHAHRENEQRKKHANLSEWNSSDTGRPFSFRGSVDVLRTARDPQQDMEDGEVCDIQLDCEQFSDFDSCK